MSNEWSLDLLPGDASDEEIDEFVAGIMADDGEGEGEGENTAPDGGTPPERVLQSGASR